jgi:hypothetical protein
MLDWGAFLTLAADATSETVTISGNSLTLLIMLLELADTENWLYNGEPLDATEADILEDIVAQATAEIIP